MYLWFIANVDLGHEYLSSCENDVCLERCLPRLGAVRDRESDIDSTQPALLLAGYAL